MMLQMSEKEIRLFQEFKMEKDEEKRSKIHEELQKMRKEREKQELKDCPFAH